MEQVVSVTKKETIPIKQQISDILVEVSWGTISTDYFGKSRSWLSKKMNEKGFNGEPGGFTDEEKEVLRGALVDLSERIRKVAIGIV